MNTKFFKSGKTLVLYVPTALARELGAAEGKRAEMTVENGALVVKVTRPRKRRRLRLEQLVEGITPENRHSAVEWARPVGSESW